jgi:hypothetical protein
VSGGRWNTNGLNMNHSAGDTPAPRRSRDDSSVVVSWEPDGEHGLTHLLALSSDLAEDRELLRACGVGAQHWVRKARVTNGPPPRRA